MNDSYLTDFSSSEENHFSNLINNNKKVKQSNNEMLVISISLILENIIQQNKKMKNYKKIFKSQKKFSFFDDEKPDISIKEYFSLYSL